MVSGFVVDRLTAASIIFYMSLGKLLTCSDVFNSNFFCRVRGSESSLMYECVKYLLIRHGKIRTNYLLKTWCGIIKVSAFDTHRERNLSLLQFIE